MVESLMKLHIKSLRSFSNNTLKRDASPRCGSRSKELESCNLYDVYRQLKEKVSGTSLNFMYSLITAVEGRDWREIQRTKGTEILLQLDELGITPK